MANSANTVRGGLGSTKKKRLSFKKLKLKRKENKLMCKNSKYRSKKRGKPSCNYVLLKTSLFDYFQEKNKFSRPILLPVTSGNVFMEPRSLSS